MEQHDSPIHSKASSEPTIPAVTSFPWRPFQLAEGNVVLFHNLNNTQRHFRKPILALSEAILK
jgi:hypothetical protein